MKFSNEQIEKAKTAKSTEELLSLAKDSGIDLSAEQAQRYFGVMDRMGELSDDELDNVSGGCGKCEVRTTWAPVCDGQFKAKGNLPFVNCGYCVYFELEDDHGFGECHRDDKNWKIG